MSRQLKWTVLGDATSFEKAVDRSGRAAKDLGADLDRATADAKSFGDAVDRAAERTDKSERTFMGTADVLDGLAAAFGLPIDRAVELGRAGGDLAGGFTSLSPAIKGFGGSLSAVATGPMGLIITGVAAAAAGLMLLWKNSETFRDIVTGAFEAVKRVVGPVFEAIGAGIGALGGLLGRGGDDAEAMSERQKKALEEMKAAYEENLAKVTGVLDEMANPLERFNHANETTLKQVVENLRFNVDEYQKWADDIRVIRERFGEDTAQFVIDQGPQWHGLADQLANSTGRIGDEFVGLIGTLDRLEREAGATASGVQSSMARMRDQLRRDLGEVNDLFGGIFFPTGFEPTYAPDANRSPVITRRHSGGVVPGPIGREVPIIAQGGERVLALGQAGGATTIQVNVSALDPGSAATAVVRAIEEYEARNGTRFARA